MKLEYLLWSDAYTPINKRLAKHIGIPQAMFLQELISQRARFRRQYWIEKFYFSQEKMKEEIWISEKTQQRYTKELINLWFIKVEKEWIPARNYYTIIDNAIINSEIFSDITNGETSADNLTEQAKIDWPNIKQEIIPINNKQIEFEDFWKKYPNKKWKDSARKTRGKMKQEEKELAYKSIELHQKYDINWNKENWQFIPYGSTYLFQKRREDEFDESKPIQNEIVIWETAPDWHTYTEKDKPGSWYYWDNQYKIYRRWSK